MNKEQSEFQRNKCFTFFESYLTGADKIKEEFGVEIGYEYLTSIIRYGLYQEKSKNSKVNAMVEALTNTIDAGQEKRENGFNRENMEMTEAILKYKKEHPNATQKQIHEATGASVGKVNKVLQRQKEMERENHVHDSVNIEKKGIHDSVNTVNNTRNSNNKTNNSNINPNSNHNSNSNYNSVNVNVNDCHDSPKELASPEKDFSFGAFKEKKHIRHSLSELSAADLDAIIERFNTRGYDNIEKDFYVTESLARELWDEYGFSPFN